MDKKMFDTYFEMAKDPETALSFVTKFVLPLFALMILPRYDMMKRLVKLIPVLVLPVVALYGLFLYLMMLDVKNQEFLEQMMQGKITASALATSFGDKVGAVVAWFHMSAGDTIVAYWIYQESVRYNLNYILHVILIVCALCFNPLAIALLLVFKFIFGRVNKNTKDKQE